MRRIFLILLLFVFACFLLPAIFTKPFQTVSQKISEDGSKKEAQNKPTYNYREYNKIKLYHTKTDEIEEIALEDYLYNVVSAEMPVSFELEALKAQALVARTYTIYQITHNGQKHGEASICDSSACCQAWISKEDRLNKWNENEALDNWNKIMQAVDETAGKIIVYEDEPINAFFHSNSGGVTEIPLHVWGGSGYPYLQTVETSGEDEYSQYYSEVEFGKEELIEKIRQTHNDVAIDYNTENPIYISEYTESGRVKTIKFGNEALSGVEARKILGLRSANFTVQILSDRVKFSVIRIWSWSRHESNRSRQLSKTRKKL